MAIIKKQIPFDLVIDGQTIADLEQLRQFPSTELLQLHANGSLGRWLRKNGGIEEAIKLDEFVFGENKANNLAYICEILGMDVDIDDIKAVLDTEEQQSTGKNEVVEANYDLNFQSSLNQDTDWFLNIAKKRYSEVITEFDALNPNNPIVKFYSRELKTKVATDVFICSDYDILGENISAKHALLFNDCKNVIVDTVDADYIFAKNIKNFSINSLECKAAVISAENIYISRFACVRGKYSNSKIILHAKNIFLDINDMYDCKWDANGISYLKIFMSSGNQFACGVDLGFDISSIPFGKNEEEIIKENIKKHKEISEDFSDSMYEDNIYEGLTRSVDAIVCASDMLNSGKEQIMFFPSYTSGSIYRYISKELSDWTEKNKIFTPEFWQSKA